MTANITDLLTQATNGTRPVPTTLTAIKAIGASSISCGALTGWATATAIHFIIYTTDTSGKKVAGSQTDWKGIVSGTTITNLTLKAGTDNGYSIGAIVECAPTAAWANDTVAFGTAQHTQLGAHTGVTTDTLTATGVVNASTVSSLQDTSVALSTYRSEAQIAFTASGGVWTGDSYASTKNASMTAWVGYINGQRGSIGAVSARVFTASKDTYVDVLNSSGVFSLVYTEVANNAASPALAANSMRIAIVVTGATNIAAAGSINQGNPSAVLPIASSIAYSVTDSLGNLIYNTTPSPTVIGYRQITTSFTTASSSATQVTGLTLPVIVPTGRKVRVTVFTPAHYDASATGTARIQIWDGTAGSGTEVARGDYLEAASVSAGPSVVSAIVSSSGSKTYNTSLSAQTTGTAHMDSGATFPAYISVELV